MTSTKTESRTTPDTGRSIDAGAAALWASFFVIIAALLAHLGSGRGQAAFAGEEAEVAGLRLLTAASGDNEEFLAVLNQQDQSLSIYGIAQGRTIELFQVLDLGTIFQEAKASTGTGQRR